MLLIAFLAGAAVYILGRWLIVERARPASELAAAAQVDLTPVGRRRRSLAEKMDTIGVKMSETTFVVLALLAGTMVLVVALAIGVPLLFALLLAAGGAYLPVLWLNWEISRQAAALAKELPGAVEDLAGALRVRQAVRPALQEVMESLRRVDPGSLLAREFERVLADTEVAGGALDVGLQKMQDRAANPDLVRLAGVLAAFHRAGPDMLSLLAQKAQDMRTELENHAEIRTSLMQQKFLIRLAVVMAAAAYFFLNSDPLTRQFQQSAAGYILVLAVAGVMAFGYLLVQAMIRDAEP